MKIRNGFVSNSSSSSFLLTLGRVCDPTKFIEFIRDGDFFGIDTTCFTKDMIDGIASPPCPFKSYRNKNDELVFFIESFLGNKIIIPAKKLNPNDMVAYMYIFGFHTDDYFTDEYDNIDYNQELYFYEYEPSLNIFKNNKDNPDILTDVDWITGAGYNG